MTDRIYVTYTPTTAPGTFHTAIHFERSSPTGEVRHYVVEARPENLERLSTLEKGFGVIEEAMRSDAGPSRFGKIEPRVQELKRGEYDENEPFEPIAEGNDLSEQLARLRLFALGVNDAGLPYRGDHQNSNTFASAALKAAGLPAATGIAHDPTWPNGELLEYFTPGLNERLGPGMRSNLSYDPAARITMPPISPASPMQQSPPPNDEMSDFYRNDPAWLLQIRR